MLHPILMTQPSLRRGGFLIILGAAFLGCEPPLPSNTCGEVAAAGGASGAAGAANGNLGPSLAGAGGAAPAQPVPEHPDTPPDLPSIASDDYAGDVEVSVHEKVNTVLVVHWTQLVPADRTWLEFGVEGEPARISRPKSGTLGAHRDVVLGVPGDTDVTVRVVSEHQGKAYKTTAITARTRPLPRGMPRPTVLGYDSKRASHERWLFGSVEDSFGGGPGGYYFGTFWVYIMDRQGRIVWYYADPASNATTSFQRRARDGEYIVLEKRCYACGDYSESVLKMTLDREYFETVPVPGLADAIDVTREGGILYDANNELREIMRDGTVRHIWSCSKHFGPNFFCYTNTINYSPKRNTVLMSYPYMGTVVEIDRETGDLVGQYGNTRGSWSFAPPAYEPPSAWRFEFQHFPNFTESGHLMVSSHMPGCSRTDRPVAHQHAFIEFELDAEQERLIERWRYTDGPEWPRAKGMAMRLANGNTLANYGTGGVIREITRDKRTVWYVKFDIEGGNDFYNKMVGHNELIDDLYTLNGGPAAPAK